MSEPVNSVSMKVSQPLWNSPRMNNCLAYSNYSYSGKLTTLRNVCQTREKFWTNGCACDMCRSEYYFTPCNRLRAVPPFPSCDRVLSMEAQATWRTVLLSPCSLRGLWFHALYKLSEEGKGGTARSLAMQKAICLSVCLSVGVRFLWMSYHLEEGLCFFTCTLHG